MPPDTLETRTSHARTSSCRRVSKDRNRIVHLLRPLLRKSSLSWIALVAALAIVVPRVVHAEALLVVEADTGKVLQAENATYPWYPASVTKLMTAYITLKAVIGRAHV